MAKTVPDLDEELLAEAMVALGVATERDAVNVALTRIVQESRARRGRALRDLQDAAARGAFDFDRLDELDKID